LEPAPTEAILEIDGRSVGRPLLADLQPVREAYSSTGARSGSTSAAISRHVCASCTIAGSD
ncbi:MAG: hypothetical protein R6W95_06760, partial [Desulfosarcina sp.]